MPIVIVLLMVDGTTAERLGHVPSPDGRAAAAQPIATVKQERKCATTAAFVFLSNLISSFHHPCAMRREAESEVFNHGNGNGNFNDRPIPLRVQVCTSTDTSCN